MKAVSILLSTLAVLFASLGTASADTRAVYTIPFISVDETAANTRDAENSALAGAKMIGLRRLVNKLTLPEDRAGLSEEFFSYENARAFSAAVDVDNERRSSTVYKADLTILYNPRLVRAALEREGVAYVDRQAPLSMVVPVAGNTALLEDWRAAWPSEKKTALNPYVKGLAFYSSNDGWASVEQEVRSVNASNAVIAELLGSEGAWQVRLTQETPGGATMIGTTNAVPGMAEAASAASAYLDTAWKRQSIVRDTTLTEISASVIYTDLATWNSLRRSLSESALISQLRVEAVSVDGAQIKFGYAGDEARLLSELRQRGVQLERGPQGWVVSSALRFSR